MADLTEDEAWELHDLDALPKMSEEQAWRHHELTARTSQPKAPADAGTPASVIPSPGPQSLPEPVKGPTSNAFTHALDKALPMPDVSNRPIQFGISAPEAEFQAGAAKLAKALSEGNAETDLVGTVREGWSALKNNVMDPIWENTVQPAARFTLGAGLETIGKVAPGAEYGLRSAEMLLGEFGPEQPHLMGPNEVPGQRFPNNMGPREAAGQTQFRDAVKRVAESQVDPASYGYEPGQQPQLSPEAADTASAYAQALIRELPKAPFMAIGGGEGSAVAQGMKSGFLGDLAMPGGDPVGSAILGGGIGGVLGAAAKGLDKLAKPKPRIEGIILPDDVKTFADELAKAPPGPKTGAPVTDVVVVGADGQPKQVSVEMQGGKPVVVDESPVGMKTPGARPSRLPPVVTDAAAEKLTDAQLLALQDLSAKETVRAVKALRAGGRYADDVQIDILSSQNPGKWDAVDGRWSNDKWENGAVVVSDDGALRIQDIDDPALKRESLKARGLVEVTLPDGSKAYGFRTPQDFGPDSSKLATLTGPDEGGMRTVLAPDPAEGLDSALFQGGEFPESSVRQLTNDRELDDAIRYAQGWRSTKPDAALNQVPPGGLPPEPPRPPQDGNGPGGEPPGPPPGPGQVDANFGPQFKWWQKMGNVGKGALNKLVGSHSRGPVDAAQLAQVQYSIQQGAFDRTFGDVFKNVQKQFGLSALPIPAQTKFAQDLNRVLEGHMSPADMATAWPQFAQAKHDLVASYKTAIDADHKRLIELGALNPAEAVGDVKAFGGSDEELANYAARTYMRHMLPPGEYARLVKKDEALINKWKKWLYDNQINAKDSKFKLMSEADKRAQTDYVLDEIIGAHDASGKGNGRNLDFLKSFKSRQEIPEMVRQILGETDNGLYRLALTRTRQKAAIANAEMWQDVHGRQDVWSEVGKNADDGTPFRHLPNDRSRYGIMAGKYLHPEWAESLIDAPLAAKAASNWFASVSRYVKTNQVLYGGAGPWLNNVLGNFSGLAMAGGVNPFTAAPEIASMAGDFKAYKAQAGAETSEAAKRVARARELLGSYGGYHKGETQAVQREMEKYLASALDAEGRPLKKSFADWARDATIGNVKKLHGGAGAAFDAIDQVAKYISWTGNLKKGGIHPVTGEINPKLAKKFLGAQYVETTPARLKKLVELEAARRVHMSFPMMDRTGAWVRKLQDSAGLAAPYIGIKSELLRTYMLAAKRMAEGEPGMRARMLAYSAATAGMITGAQELRRANGISDEEVERGLANMPDSSKRFHPGMGALWWRDDKGRVQYWDVAQGLVDPLQYAQGEPARDLWKRILGNALMTPVEGGVAGIPIKELLATMDLADPEFETKVAEYKKGSAQVMDDLWRKGALPTAPIRMMDRAQAGGLIGQVNPMSPKPDQTQLQAIINTMLGNRVFPEGRPGGGMAPVYDQREAKRNLSQALHNKTPNRIEGSFQGIQGLFGGDSRQRAVEQFKQKVNNKGAKK